MSRCFCPCWRTGAGPASRYRSWMPARAASRSTASTNVRWSVSMTNRIASPPAPQPWQKYRLRVAETVNDGVFSSWNGHSPLRLPPPAGLRVTCSEITSTIEVRSRTSPMSSSRILPAMVLRSPPGYILVSAVPGLADRARREYGVHADGLVDDLGHPQIDRDTGEPDRVRPPDPVQAAEQGEHRFQRHEGGVVERVAEAEGQPSGRRIRDRGGEFEIVAQVQGQLDAVHRALDGRTADL